MASPRPFPDLSVDWHNAPSPDDSDALERWLLSRLAHLSAEQGTDPDKYVYPRGIANAEQHWTRAMLIDEDVNARYTDDGRAIDPRVYFDVPDDFHLDHKSAPKLVAQNPGAAVNLLRALHHARLPCGKNMGLWVTTDALTNACRPLAPSFWRSVAKAGLTDFLCEVAKEESFLGESIVSQVAIRDDASHFYVQTWVISIMQQITYALEYCSTQRQLGRRGDDLGMTPHLSRIVSVLCTNALKNQEVFVRIVAPDGAEITREVAPRLTKMLRERMGSMLLLYQAMYMPIG